MGKKATLLYFRFITILFTLAVAVFTILVGVKAHNSPYESFFWSFFGLGMMPILLFNVLLMLYWIIRLKIWFIIPLVAIGLNYKYIEAKYQFSNKEAHTITANDKLITIASFNVESFHGYPSVYSLGEITELMKEQQTDIICMQEVATSTTFTLDSISAMFKEYPFSYIDNRVNGLSLAIYSKYPLVSSANFPFYSTKNGAIWANINVNDNIIKVINCHLQTTNFNQTKSLLKNITLAGFYESKKEAVRDIYDKMSENARMRATQTDIICRNIDSTKHSVILCGDFNDTPTSYTYYQITERLQDGFISAGSGFEYTFRYLHRLFRIDYIFHSKDITGIKYTTPSFEFSDHNPVFMRVAIKKG